MAVKKVKYDIKFSNFTKVRLVGDKRERAITEVGEFVTQKIFSDMDAQRSSVSGSKWKNLSKEYAEKKGRNVADLFLEGDYRSGLTFRPITGGVRITFEDQEQGKADGHNNFSGRSNLPLRQSIPKENETFRDPIMNGIERIVSRIAGAGKK